MLELAFWMVVSSCGTSTDLLSHFQEIIEKDDLWKKDNFSKVFQRYEMI